MAESDAELHAFGNSFNFAEIAVLNYIFSPIYFASENNIFGNMHGTHIGSLPLPPLLGAVAIAARDGSMDVHYPQSHAHRWSRAEGKERAHSNSTPHPSASALHDAFAPTTSTPAPAPTPFLPSNTAHRNRRICRQCGWPGRYKDGKCVEKWGPGPLGPGTVCDRCRKSMKRRRMSEVAAAGGGQGGQADP
ncbi:hypothetical protein B0H12DRAFT_1246534 [Mycena haematopus]|nr:hypothetical protein B0H12DRAFT_1246534 [Mycena haematopus]